MLFFYDHRVLMFMMIYFFILFTVLSSYGLADGLII